MSGEAPPAGDLLRAAAAAGTPLLELCLAVLLAAMALVFLVSGRDAAVGATYQPPWRTLSAPLGRGPPRLLLARLCVLRI